MCYILEFHNEKKISKIKIFLEIIIRHDSWDWVLKLTNRERADSGMLKGECVVYSKAWNNWVLLFHEKCVKADVYVDMLGNYSINHFFSLTFTLRKSNSQTRTK